MERESGTVRELAVRKSKTTSWRPRVASLATLALALVITGCRPSGANSNPDDAAFTITVKNEGADIHQLEVDYPNASFGRDLLASGDSYTYPPKLMGSGPVKVMFNDSAGKSHTATGPVVQEGLRKNLVISIGEDEGVIFEALPH